MLSVRTSEVINQLLPARRVSGHRPQCNAAGAVITLASFAVQSTRHAIAKLAPLLVCANMGMARTESNTAKKHSIYVSAFLGNQDQANGNALQMRVAMRQTLIQPCSSQGTRAHHRHHRQHTQTDVCAEDPLAHTHCAHGCTWPPGDTRLV